MKTRKKRIYYIGNKYPEERCVISKLAEYEYVDINKERNIMAILDRIIQKVRHRVSAAKGEKALSIYRYGRKNGVIHCFNACIDSSTDWICNFETIIPRTNCTRSSDWMNADQITLQGVHLLAGESCLHCFALSEASLKYEIAFLDSLKGKIETEEINRIKDKISVLHPPQKLMITEKEIEKKFHNKETKEFIFVGHDFFRKGGKEILQALMELKKNYNFHLTVISKLEYNDYASKATLEEKLYCQEILNQEEWISYYDSLDNEKVMELCKTAHIGLLPTFADTYGYSVLEMQSCGCIMITTDIRALLEINNEDCGYICPIEKNEFGEALYSTEEQRERMKVQLAENLKATLEEILKTDMDILLRKAMKSYRKIEKEHNPHNYADAIRKVIENARTRNE